MDTLWQLQETETTLELHALAEQYLAHCIHSLKLSPKTIKTRATHMRYLIKYCDSIGVTKIDQISLMTMDGFLQDYQTGRAISTVNTARRVYKTFFNWIRDYKETATRIDAATIRLVREPRKRPRAMDMDMIRNVIRGCRNIQDALMISVFIEAGLRIEELSILKVKDIRGDTIDVTGKGAEDRMVYISDSLARRLSVFTEFRDQDDFIFVNDHSTTSAGMDTKTIRRHVQRWFKSIAGVDMQPHQLRHTYAVNTLENGGDLITIQRLLGHKDVTTTQKYLLLSDAHLRINYKKYAEPVSK